MEWKEPASAFEKSDLVLFRLSRQAKDETIIRFNKKAFAVSHR